MYIRPKLSRQELQRSRWDLPVLRLTQHLQLCSDLACQLTGIATCAHYPPDPKITIPPLLFFVPPFLDEAKLSAYRSPHSSSSWEHLAWDIWNLISRYLHRLKQFRIQTSEGPLQQTSRQKLSVHFIFFFFFWQMSWEYQYKVCTGLRMLKDTQVLDL